MSDKSGVLYVIATPIGNLEDISLRARRVLQEVDLILAEDTRHSRILLDHLQIHTPMRSYHEHNERAVVADLLGELRHGRSLALISDAGTPLLCDPGFPLVSAAHEQGVRIVPVPGPAAVTTALSVSGMAADRFVFEGFLRGKAAARRERLKSLIRETRTMVFYEAPHRILQLLEEIQEIMGGRREVCVGRELTKKYETVYRGSCADVLGRIKDSPDQQLGEFVVILKGYGDREEPGPSEAVRVLQILLTHGLPVKLAASITAAISGGKKNKLYRMALQLAEK